MKCSDCGVDSCVLKEIEMTGGYVSTQRAQWPPPPRSYQPGPRLRLTVSPGQLVPAPICRGGQLYDGDAVAFEIYASEDRDAVLEMRVITVAEKCMLWRLEKSCWLFCSSTSPHLCSLSNTYQSTSLPLNILSVLLLSSLSILTSSCPRSYSHLLFLLSALLSRHFLLLLMSAPLHLFTHLTSINAKHIIAPRGLVISSMLAGLLMSPPSSVFA